MTAFDDLISKQRTGSSSAKKTGLSKGDAQRMLDNRLTKIVQQGSPKAAAGAIKTGKREGPKESPVGKFLGLLGKPLAATASVVKEGVDFAQGEGFSPSDLRKQFNDGYGFGKLLEEETSLPLWAKRGLGFVGDVALDPLTYLAPQAKLGRLGARGVAKELGEKGLESAGARVLQKGVSSLADDELAAIGAKGGLYLNMPGTGRVGRAVGRKVGVDVAEKQVRIAGRNALTTGVARTAQGAKAGVLGTEAAAKVGRLVGGDRRTLKEALRSGDADKAFQALHTLDSDNARRLIERQFESEHGQTLHDFLSEAKRAGVDGEALWHAAAGDGAAAAQVDSLIPGGTERASSFFDTVQQAANDKAGIDWLMHREDYAPRFLSEQAKEAGIVKPGASGGSAFGKGSIEQRAKYVADEDFLGTKLLDPKTAGKSIEKQMDEIAVREFGDKAVHLFNQDAYETFPRYLRTLSKKTGHRWMEQDLLRKGVAEPLWAKEATTSSLQRVAAKSRVLKHAERALGRQRLADVRLRQTTADIATERANKGAAQAAARDAAATVGAENPNAKAIAAIREYGDWIGEQADTVGAHADTLPGDVTTHGSEDIAQAAVQAHTTRVAAQDTAVRFNRLEAERGRLEAKLARAHVSVADQIKAGAQASADQTALEELRGELDDEAARLLDSGRTVEQVQHERTAIYTKLQGLRDERRSLERQIAVAEDHGFADGALSGVEAGPSQLDTAKARLDALNKLIAQGEGFATRSASELSAIRRVQDRFGAVDQLAGDVPQTTSLGGDFGQLDNELSALPPSDGRTWYHGSFQGSFDAMNPPAHLAGEATWADTLSTPKGTNYRSEADAFIGPSFTVDRGTAEEYATRQGAVGGARIHVANPKVYESATNDLATQALTGSPAPSDGLRQIHNDMFQSGWDAGVLTPEALTERMPAALRDDMREAWDEVLRLTDEEGVDLPDAVHFVFADDPNFQDVLGDLPIDRESNTVGVMATDHDHTYVDATGAIEDEVQRLYSAVVYKSFGQADAPTLAAAADEFRYALTAEGYDGVIHTHDGSDALFPLDPQQVEFTDGRPGFKDYWQERQRILTKLQEPVTKYQDALAQVDRSLATVAVDAKQTAQLARENDRALASVQRRIANERAQLGKQAHEVALAEFGLRSKAAEKYALADELDAQFHQAQVAGATAQVDEAETAYMKAQGEIVRLEGQAAQQQADLLAANKSVDLWGEWTKKLGNAEVEYKVRNLLREGMKEFGPNTQASELVVDALSAATKLDTPEGLAPFVRAWDGFTNLWKGYATLTPGFHSRNFMGGVFNNWLAGVELGRQRQFTQAYVRYTRTGSHGLTGKAADAFDRLAEAGILSGGQTVAEVERKVGQLGRSFNPLSTGNVLTQGSRGVGEHVENSLRGALAWDVILKGGSEQDAINAVYKYHFDYEDLSAFERSVVRRVVPFYTWTRKNLPLMLEEMVRQPGKFATVYKAKQELELGTSPEGIVPGYFGDNLAVHLPFKVPGQPGGEQYLLPDLPFRDLTKTVNPANLLGMTNPLIKTPLEMKFGKQVFNGAPIDKGYQEAPAVLKAVPGVLPALKLFGKVKTNSSGKPMVRGTDLYLLEQALPIFGRARRLFPSEEKYSQRVATTWLGFIFGAGVRTNTDTEQRNELMRRLSSLDATWADEKALGNVSDGTAPQNFDQLLASARGK